ncbi:MAG: hypothetical protein Tsb009_38020 [Planctomycetaceae bacterium]
METISYKRTVASHPESATESGELPNSLPLNLVVRSSETIAELCDYPEGEAREQFALEALRIGVMALKQARGQLDAELVRRESDRLLQTLDGKLNEHSRSLNDRMTNVLKEYFDPNNGRFQERIDRLIKRDGELEQLLIRQIGEEDSALCKTLTSHVGEDSPLMKHLGLDEAGGLLSSLRETLESQLESQRDNVLKQFSLDNKDGALARFLAELNEHHGELTDNLQQKIDEVVGEFSLDDEQSALSRLVKNVERAQKTITSEFSLDEESSALSKLKKMLEVTNSEIHNHLSLDEQNSALSRLKRELLELNERDRKINQEFQEEVKIALNAMVARKQEAERSTRHGVDFEDALYTFLQHEMRNSGDLLTQTGNTTGRIKNCKVGDCLLELGPESTAAGGRIVFEAKEKSGVSQSDALSEIDTARKNRDAQVGLFVYSKKSAPEGMEPFARYGHDVLVVWDAENPESDIILRAAISLARALCVRAQQLSQEASADFTAIDEAVREIEKRAASLDDVETWAKTIQNNSDKILKKIGALRKSLIKQVETLDEKTEELKRVLKQD